MRGPYQNLCCHILSVQITWYPRIQAGVLTTFSPWIWREYELVVGMSWVTFSEPQIDAWCDRSLFQSQLLHVATNDFMLRNPRPLTFSLRLNLPEGAVFLVFITHISDTLAGSWTKMQRHVLTRSSVCCNRCWLVMLILQHNRTHIREDPDLSARWKPY